MTMSVEEALKSTSNAFKKWGNKFEDLYDNFKKMVDAKGFKFPKLDFSAVGKGFVNAANELKSRLKDIEKAGSVQSGVGAVSLTGSVGYTAVKASETAIVKPMVDWFCGLVKPYTNKVVSALNKVTQLITGVLPSWLVKIALYGGLGLASFFFKAFTVGVDFGYEMLGQITNFEAGFALELKSNLQIGTTGCYLGGSSGVGMGVSIAPLPSTGFAVTAFKEYGNIAGDSTTIGVEGDICNLLFLPCQMAISGGIIWDNTDWNNGNSVALQTFQTCFAPKAEYALAIADLQLHRQATLNMLQTGGKNLLEKTYDFFENGFSQFKTCAIAVFDLWIGLTLDVSAGVEVGSPVKGSFTIDYAYCT